MSMLRAGAVTRPEALRHLSLADSHTPAELRLAYKRAAFHAHPDRPGGNTETLKIVNAAYEALGGTGKPSAFVVDTEAAEEAQSPSQARRRARGGPPPADHAAQKQVLYWCTKCRTVFPGGGLMVDHCTQVLPDKSVCGGEIDRYEGARNGPEPVRTGHGAIQAPKIPVFR